ncbi:Hypothetical predicted protein [Octopus vulgaris]|uniref:Uncharacterized protein n=1 Tax=Octopus vulgaris TaxID=6645 RepID=A0AA36BHF0_OCTVU|nr:Hypothetical predicted protein [Octopus vulgaris]
MRAIYILLALCFILSVQHLASGQQSEASDDNEVENEMENEVEEEVEKEVAESPDAKKAPAKEAEENTAIKKESSEPDKDEKKVKKTNADYARDQAEFSSIVKFAFLCSRIIDKE